MAIITYTQDAVLGAYQQWLMQQGAQACLEKRIIGQDAPDCGLQAGTVYAQAGSLLRYSVLTTLSTVNVSFFGQFQTESRMWANVGQVVTGTSAGGIDRITQIAVAGCYKNMVADVGTAVVTGTQVYVLVELGRTNNGAFVPYAVLLSGYVTTNEPLDSTGGPRGRPTPSGSGGSGCCPETVNGSSFDPDSSNPYIVTPDANENIALQYLEYSFTTSGTAGNRRQFLQVGTVNYIAFNVQMLIDQPASTNYGYKFVAGGQDSDDTTNNEYVRGIPLKIWHAEAMYVTIQRTNPKAGDAWSFADVSWLERN